MFGTYTFQALSPSKYFFFWMCFDKMRQLLKLPKYQRGSRGHTYCDKLTTFQWNLAFPSTVRHYGVNKNLGLITFWSLGGHAKFAQKLKIDNLLAWPLRLQNLTLRNTLSFMIPKQFLEWPNSIRKLAIYYNMCQLTNPPLKHSVVWIFKISSFQKIRFRIFFWWEWNIWNLINS